MKYLNVRTETMKLLAENTGKKLLDMVLLMIFLKSYLTYKQEKQK